MANVKEVRGSKEKLDGVGVLLMVIMMFTLIYYLNTANSMGWFSNETSLYSQLHSYHVVLDMVGGKGKGPSDISEDIEDQGCCRS